MNGKLRHAALLHWPANRCYSTKANLGEAFADFFRRRPVDGRTNSSPASNLNFIGTEQGRTQAARDNTKLCGQER